MRSSMRSSMHCSLKSSSRRVTRFNPFSLQSLGTLKNQNIRNLVQLLIKKNRSPQIITQINYYLQHVIGLQYFKQLKMILNEVDYNTVLDRLNAEYRLQGMVIVEKRKRNDYFYVILDGSVRIMNQVMEDDQIFEVGKEREYKYEVINKLHVGDCFGEASLLNLKRETTARVQAMTDCILLTIDYHTFIKIVSKITLIKKQQIVSLLSKSSLFYNINKTYIKDLIVEIQECKYGLNEVIYTNGHPHDAIYFVKTGMVQISEGDVKLMTLVVGENFGVEYGKIDGYGQESMRCQEAKSKSSELIIYKLPFARLKVLQGCYQQVIDNIHQDYLNKKRVSQRLMTNHSYIRKIMTSTNSVKSQKKKQCVFRKRIKNKTASKVPQWWGIVERHEDDRIKNQSNMDKQNQCNGGLLGSKRIDELKRIASQHKSVPCEEVTHPSMCRPIFGQLRSTLSKKTVRKVSVMQTDLTEIIRKKIKPKFKKDKLIGYAKSTINCWDFTF